MAVVCFGGRGGEGGLICDRMLKEFVDLNSTGFRKILKKVKRLLC